MRRLGQERIPITPFRSSSAMNVTDLPDRWRLELEDYSWRLQTIGDSGASTFRLEAYGKPSLFLKSQSSGPFSEIAAEAARLRWLAAMGIPCPILQRVETHDGRDWLLMTALEGADCASLGRHRAGVIVECMADALHELHGLDIKSCPFDHTLARRIDDARRRVCAGVVDETDFDEEHIGMPPGDLFEKLIASRPRSEDLVVAHGDACLPNLIIDDGRVSGFIDCGRLGVADRYQDLALAARSIASNLGPSWVAPFFVRYGVERPQPAKLAFYRLLDEFF
jgi:aminoglycoside 3'-phosphotransferase-2